MAALGRKRVLIIDDDELVTGVFVNTLRSEFDVDVVNDAEAALQLVLEDEGIDLVYCDLMMRELTGMDIYDEVRATAPQKLRKLVFMTGGAFTPRSAAFVTDVPDQVVYKPFSILAETRKRLAMTEKMTEDETPLPPPDRPQIKRAT